MLKNLLKAFQQGFDEDGKQSPGGGGGGTFSGGGGIPKADFTTSHSNMNSSKTNMLPNKNGIGGTATQYQTGGTGKTEMFSASPRNQLSTQDVQQIGEDLKAHRRTPESITPWEQGQIAYNLTHGPVMATEEQRNAANKFVENIGSRIRDAGVNAVNAIGETTGSWGSYILSDATSVPAYFTNTAQSAWEHDAPANLEAQKRRMEYIEKQLQNAPSREAKEYWLGRKNGQEKAIDYAQENLESMQRHRYIPKAMDAVTDRFKEVGDLLAESASQRFPDFVKPYVSPTINLAVDYTESKVDPRLGAYLAAGDSIRDARNAGAGLGEQTLAGAVGAASSLGGAKLAKIHSGASARVWEDLAKNHPYLAKIAQEGTTFGVGNALPSLSSWLMNKIISGNKESGLHTKSGKQSQSYGDFEKADYDELSSLIYMSSMARMRKRYALDLTDQLWNVYKPMEAGFGFPMTGSSSRMSNPWTKARIDAAEETILELWDTLSTGVPVEDALEANRMYPLFTALWANLEKRRRLAETR